MSATPQDVARIAVVEGAAALGAQGAWLALVDAPGSALDYVASTGFAEGWVEKFHAIPLEAPTAATDVVRDGRARFFEDADRDDGGLSGERGCLPGGRGRGDSAVLPLNRGAAPIGMMAFHWRQAAFVLAPAERDLARTFADTAAQALERARLYAEVRGTAEAFQRSLLPTFLPTFPEYEIAVRYRPASETLAIGGDWYDVVERIAGRSGSRSATSAARASRPRRSWVGCGRRCARTRSSTPHPPTCSAASSTTTP